MLVADDFSNAQTGTLSRASSIPERFELGYFDGDYFIRRIDPEANGSFLVSVGNRTYTDSRLAVDMRFVDRRANQEGYLYCRWSPPAAPSTGYRLGFNGAGVFNLRRYDNGVSTLLATFPRDPTMSPPDLWHRIALECNGDNIVISRDGVVVGSVRDDAYSEGRLAIGSLWGTVAPEIPTEVRFGNLAVVGPKPPASVSRQYSERRTDGSVWLVSQWTDGHFSESLITAARPTSTPVPARSPTATPRPAPRYPLIAPPTDDTRFWCVTANPRCSRDPWWVEWDALQNTEIVEFQFAPGLLAQRRFIESIWLVWQWPEGKDLLREAGANGVYVHANTATFSDAFASYVFPSNEIRFNRTFTETSTWMIADVLAHELKHASDVFQGIAIGRTSADCITREQRAYGVEARFLRWLSARMGGLPSVGDVAVRLSLEDYHLFTNLEELAYTSNPSAAAARDYRGHC